MVQAAQEHANHVSLLEQTKQFADYIRSQSLEIRELAEMNEWLMVFANSLLAAPRARELRMREWPSIVPGATEDFHIVVNHHSRFGAAFVETGLDRADYETTITDLMTGQHSDPLRVVMFSIDTDRAEDVSHPIAQEILRRLELEGRSVPSELGEFIDRHVGRDRQLTLRLVLT